MRFFLLFLEIKPKLKKSGTINGLRSLSSRFSDHRDPLYTDKQNDYYNEPLTCIRAES